MDRSILECGEILRGSLERGGTRRALEYLACFHEGKVRETHKGIHGDEVTERPERCDASERAINSGLQSGWSDSGSGSGSVKSSVHE